MPSHCDCGQEINDLTETCPCCAANIRAIRAERQLAIANEALVGFEGWRDVTKAMRTEIATLKTEARALQTEVALYAGFIAAGWLEPELAAYAKANAVL